MKKLCLFEFAYLAKFELHECYRALFDAKAIGNFVLFHEHLKASVTTVLILLVNVYFIQSKCTCRVS